MKCRAAPWLLSICLCLCAVLLGGCSVLGPNTPSVVSVTLTDQVDSRTMAPQSSLASFPAKAPLIYATALVKSPRKGTKVEARWSFDREGKGNFFPVDATNVTFPADDRQKYVAFSLKPATEFLPGTYKVVILLDDKPVREVTFTITAS